LRLARYALAMRWLSLFSLLISCAAISGCPRDERVDERRKLDAPSANEAARREVPTPPSDAGGRSEAADAGDSATLLRGAELYGRMCAVCHGERGEGYAADRAPSLSHPELLASVSDEFLSFAIAVGRQGTKMSAWLSDQGGPLTRDDLAALVDFMRSWQSAPTLTLDERPASGDRAKGKLLFEQKCARCHGANGPYVRIRNRQWLLHASAGFVRHAIRKGRPGTEMAAYEALLTEQQVEDLTVYLKSLPNWMLPGEAEGSAEPPPIPLGAVPLNPKGRDPRGFARYPDKTSIAVVAPELLKKRARMVLLDARAPSDYAREHIAGAVSVPFYDPAPYLSQLPKNTWLVCYCGCPHAESGKLAEQLIEAGFEKVTVLDEGLDAWVTNKYPMRSGLEP
jgi:cytochrome c oxidase cbb3-type subunit III